MKIRPGELDPLLLQAKKELPWGLLPILKEVEDAVARKDWATALNRIPLLDGVSEAAMAIHELLFNRATGRRT